MAFYSNGQRESFPSGGGSSGDSDSEEQRFHAKGNSSQRQHSSPTSASSSDSEPSGGGSSGDSDSEEQRFHAKGNSSQRQHSSPTSASSSDSEQEVSARPAAEKLAAPPSPKKNPNSSDRSAVRNQSIPSEPNPNTRSASKAKNVAEKRAKDDALAEEQPAPKKQLAPTEKKPAEDDEGETEQKKKTASKLKNAAKEEVLASNPWKKKSRKRQLEYPSPVPKVTPANDSQQKKTARVWTENDENVSMHCYLVCAKEGLEYSKNKEQFFEKMNGALAHKASETQLYEKMRSMKRRYESIQNKMVQGQIKEDAFPYKSFHEKELFKLWKQAWGEQQEEDEMDVHQTEAVGEDKAFAGHRTEENEKEEEEVESDGGTEIDKEPKVPSTEKAPVSNPIAFKRPVSSRRIHYNNPEDRLVYETITKEIMDMLAEVTRSMKKIAETAEAELKALLRPN